MFVSLRTLSFAALLVLSPMLSADALTDDIAGLQHGWAHAFYVTPEKRKDDEFKQLDARAADTANRHAGRAEPLVWQAIILSSHAKFAGGLSALGMIKQARGLLESAEKIDPTVLDGSIYTSLGSLYLKAPGWPVSFGDKKKAKLYLDKALEINPDGIDPNFFYGEWLMSKDDAAGARARFEKALKAPDRPGREDADAGRREEISRALASLR